MRTLGFRVDRHLGAANPSRFRGHESFSVRVEVFGTQPQTIEEAHIGAIHRYKSRQLRNVSSLLLVADANPKAAETRSEWKRLLCDQLTIENVAGNHFTMMRDPNVAGLARKVRDWLERR